MGGTGGRDFCLVGANGGLTHGLSRVPHTLMTHAFLGKSCSSQCLLKE